MYTCTYTHTHTYKDTNTHTHTPTHPQTFVACWSVKWTPNVRGWHESDFSVIASNSGPAISLVLLQNAELFTFFHWDGAIVWSCNTSKYDTVGTNVLLNNAINQQTLSQNSDSKHNWHKGLAVRLRQPVYEQHWLNVYWWWVNWWSQWSSGTNNMAQKHRLWSDHFPGHQLLWSCSNHFLPGLFTDIS